MADVKATVLSVQRPLGGVPYGNMTNLPFSQAFVSGVATGTDKATAVAVADVIILGTMPKGFVLKDAVIKATARLGAPNSVITLGFKYTDGVDVASPNAQDADYFCSAMANTTAFITRASNASVSPVTLPKDAYLIATIGGAALSGSGSLLVDVIGIADQS